MAKFQGLQQAARAAQSQGGGNGGSKMARFGQQMKENPQQAGFLANALGRAASQAGQGQPSTQVQGQSVGGRGPMGMLQANMQKQAQAQRGGLQRPIKQPMGGAIQTGGPARAMQQYRSQRANLPTQAQRAPVQQRNQRFASMLRAGRGRGGAGGRFGRG